MTETRTSPYQKIRLEGGPMDGLIRHVRRQQEFARFVYDDPPGDPNSVRRTANYRRKDGRVFEWIPPRPR